MCLGSSCLQLDDVLVCWYFQMIALSCVFVRNILTIRCECSPQKSTSTPVVERRDCWIGKVKKANTKAVLHEGQMLFRDKSLLKVSKPVFLIWVVVISLIKSYQCELFKLIWPWRVSQRNHSFFL